MDPSFTREEQRFVLAEMIKRSRVDIEALALFIRGSDIEPDWMNMQLPHGRNMNQCIQIAEHLAIPSPSLKRKQSSEQIEHIPKRRAASDVQAHPPPTESFEQQAAHRSTPPHVAILPRPANGFAKSPPTQPVVMPPKKRGRPSRADKAKRDLRPLLPQHPRHHLAPRPPLPLVPNTPRPILPAVNHPQDQRPSTPPTAYSASPASDGPRGRKRGRPPSGEQARPASRSLSRAGPTLSNVSMQRVLADEFPRDRLPRLSGPIPLEPDPRTNTHLQAPLEGLPATLPALIKKDVGTAHMSSTHESHASLANSA